MLPLIVSLNFHLRYIPKIPQEGTPIAFSISGKKGDTNETKLKGLVKDLEAPNRRLIICAKKNFCMTVQGNTLTGTVLAAELVQS